MEGLKKPAFLMIAFLGVVAPLSVTEHHLIMQHKESLRQKAFEASLEGRITAAIRDFRNINATSLPLKTRSVLTELFRRYLGSGSADQHERQTIGEEFLLMMNHLYLIEITHLSVKNKSESGAKLFVHPAYGIDGQGWFLGLHVYTRYLKVTFFNGAALQPLPPGESKSKEVRYLDIREDDRLDEKQLTTWLKQAATLPGWNP